MSKGKPNELSVWVVVDPFGDPIPQTVASTRQLSTECEYLTVGEGGGPMTWQEWRQKGYRCIRYTLTPEDQS